MKDRAKSSSGQCYSDMICLVLDFPYLTTLNMVELKIDGLNSERFSRAENLPLTHKFFLEALDTKSKLIKKYSNLYEDDR